MIQRVRSALKILREQGLYTMLCSIYYFFEMKNIRKRLAYEYISGKGIEIGGLINPTRVNTDTTRVLYVDYADEELLKKHYNIGTNSPQKTDFFCSADNLYHFEDSSLDFIIGNHLFEHLTNPIAVLLEWNRVLKNGGRIFMAIPDKRRTFDRNRNRTTLEHLVLDYTNPSEDRDWQHYVDYAAIELTDAVEIEKTANEYKKLNYNIHFHVFLQEDIEQLIHWCNDNLPVAFEIVHIKSTLENIGDNEFIVILQVKK